MNELKNQSEGMIELSKGLYINSPEREKLLNKNVLLEFAKNYNENSKQQILPGSVRREFKRMASSLIKKANNI